jgi:hypothetical protein
VKRADNLELNLTTLKFKLKKKKNSRPCMHIDIEGGQNMKIGGNPKASCFWPIHHTQFWKESLNPLIWWNTISFHFCKRKWLIML